MKKTWTDYVQSLYEGEWWKTEEAQRIADKRTGKTWAQSMGLETARLLGPNRPCVIKPSRGYGAKGVQIVRNPLDIVIEEVVTDVDGLAPPRDFRVYVICGESSFIEVCRHADPHDHTRLTECRYYWAHDFSIADIDRIHRADGREIVDVSHEDLRGIMSKAERVSAEFSLKAMRVDFYITREGAIYSEMCATPGLIKGGWIRSEFDCLFGELIFRAQDAIDTAR